MPAAGLERTPSGTTLGGGHPANLFRDFARDRPVSSVQGAAQTGQDTQEQHLQECVLACSLHFLAFSRVTVYMSVLSKHTRTRVVGIPGALGHRPVPRRVLEQLQQQKQEGAGRLSRVQARMAHSDHPSLVKQ